MDWNWGNRAKLRELWAEGLSTAEIGRRLGCTKNCVVGRAHRDNLPPRPSPIRPAADPDTARRRREKRASPEHRAKERIRHQEAAARRRQAYFPPTTDTPPAPGEETIRQAARRLGVPTTRVHRLVETVPGLGRRVCSGGSASWRWLICDPSRLTELLEDRADAAIARVRLAEIERNPDALVRGEELEKRLNAAAADDLNPFDPKHWWP